MNDFWETIFALAGAPFKSALNIFRLSGKDALAIINQLTDKKISEPNKAVLTTLTYKDQVIDQAVVVFYQSPKSFTGEDSVEIMIHGSMQIIKQLSATLIQVGARPAGPGEFSYRAFSNKKIDLVQAEAINDLINADGAVAKQIALNNLTGNSSRIILEMIEAMTTILATIVVGIDYPEYYDIDSLQHQEVIARLEDIVVKGQAIQQHSLQAQSLVQGVKVALVGKPNVGKSTLLNALLKQDKAITSNIPGTTRDIVEGARLIDGINFLFLDTAGLHDSDEIIENKGIEKSYQAIKECDIVVVVLDSNNLEIEDKKILALTANKKRIVIRNKKDLNPQIKSKHLLLSALSSDVSLLEAALVEKAGGLNFNYQLTASLINGRQIGELEAALTYIDNAIKQIASNVPVDLFIKDLELARSALGRIVGQEILPDLEQEVFSRFCVGK